MLVDVSAGDGNGTAAVWELARGRRQRRLVFGGPTADGTYACRLDGGAGGLTLGRRSHWRWPDELARFVAALDG